MKNYVETTDMVVLSDADEYKLNGYENGYDFSDSDDDVELPPIPSPKVCFNQFNFRNYLIGNFRKYILLPKRERIG